MAAVKKALVDVSTAYKLAAAVRRAKLPRQWCRLSGKLSRLPAGFALS